MTTRAGRGNFSSRVSEFTMGLLLTIVVAAAAGVFLANLLQ
jgi:hypothetical protein